MLAVTALFEGIRAGAGTFRLILDLPARFTIGPLAFAEFSRATDLSTRGIVFYSLYGFGGALLTGGTWYAAWRSHAPRLIQTLLGIACSCSVAVLLFTTQAAPLMWKVGSVSSDTEMLSGLLDRFTVWTVLRIACVNVSFVAVITSMTILLLKSRMPVVPREGAADEIASDVIGR